MQLYDVIIIGGGIAGYYSAIQLMEQHKNLSIVLLEKERTPLKKLLTTGNGACNFTHSGTIENFLTKYGTNGNFLRNAFQNSFVKDIVSFFENNGIKTICREDGKYFPASMNAADIKDLFIKKTKTIDTVFDFSVTNVVKRDDTFYVSNKIDTYQGKKVVITTGGCSFPHTGSTGDGFAFAESLGHTVNNPRPSLASIFCNEHTLAFCSGLSFENVKIVLEKDKKSKKFEGDLLITHKGFSGPVIIDNSRYFNIGDTISISFTKEKKHDIIQYLRTQKNEICIICLKKYGIPKKLAQYFLEELQIELSKKNCEISNQKIDSLAHMICSYTIIISNIEGFESCMCTNGGVHLKEIDPQTYESKLVLGLFFLGEVLDIDGDSGGYNLQAIWSECALFAKHFLL